VTAPSIEPLYVAFLFVINFYGVSSIVFEALLLEGLWNVSSIFDFKYRLLAPVTRLSTLDLFVSAVVSDVF
jgi:hypothetical protein